MSTTIAKETIILPMLARGFPNQTINDYLFEDCTIEGPAVLYPKDCTFEECIFDIHPASGFDSIIWPLPQKAGIIVGGIAAIDCVFKRCHFIGVGFLMNEKLAAAFRTQVKPSS